MTDLIRRFKGLGVALVVLAMSAGVVFASAPRPHTDTDSQATVEDPSDEASESAETEEDSAEAPESEEASGDTAEGTEDGSGGPVDNHGALVSEAAQMSTPPDFANHGAFVSCVAHMGKDVDPATFDWTTVTPESCAAAAEAAKAARDAAKAAREEAKAAREEARAAAGKGKGHTKTHGHNAGN